VDYIIAPDGTGKYIVIKIKGPLRHQDSMQVLIEALDLGAELGIEQYLLDVTESPHAWPLGVDYTFVHETVRNEAKFNRSAKTAVLVSPEDTSHDFIIMVSSNAGLNIRLFRDRDQALAFLAGN